MEHPPHDPANIEIKITMLVHIDSTAVHIFDVKVEDKTKTNLLKSNGVFLDLLKNYVDSKENSD